MTDSVFSSTRQLATEIREGRVSAEDVLEDHLAQIERHNPTLNAVVTLDEEGARTRAREADDALACGEVWGPLDGVPFSLKDAHSTARMRTTVGFPPLDHVPEADSTVTARLKAAGGILVGKTNVPGMLADYQSDNPIFGRTNNPWDVDRTPGGSSGGAAAAVASGMTPFDVGTDLSGSIRIPAHFCGLFGLKPTERRVSLAGLVPDPRGTPRSVRVMSCIGPMARTVDDIALLYSVMAGPDGRDTDVQPVPIEDMPTVEFEDLRIAFAPTLPGVPIAGEIRAAIEELALELGDEGATVEEASLPALDIDEELSRASELIGMTVGAFQPRENEQPTTLAEYMEALHLRDESIAAWERFFEDWDALLCPPSMTTAFPHCDAGSPLQVDERPTDYEMVAAHTSVFNYTGHPAIVLPCMRGRDGLPIGVQLVGRRWGESRLLAIAKNLSEMTGGFQRPLESDRQDSHDNVEN